MTTNNNRYPGGKGGDGVYQQIINRIPPHKVYVSAFAGKDAVFRNKLLSSITILNDTDPQIALYWKSYFKDIVNVSVVENFIQTQMFTNVDKPAVILRSNNAINIIERFKKNPDTFIYLDPPYPMHVRKSKRQLYAFEFADIDQHIELLNKAKQCTCDVMISTYKNELYNKLLLTPGDQDINGNDLKNWCYHEFPAQTRAGVVMECIYMNYPRPSILHDFRYLGRNYRDRERIKKKVIRFKQKLSSMEESERCAILSTIVNNHLQTITTIIDL